MRILRLLIGVFCAALIITGCSGQASAPDTPNATPTGNTPDTGIPTPASDQVGTVVGHLINTKPQGAPAPLSSAPVYLGIILKSQQGAEGLVQLSKASAPKAIVDEQGRFVFTNVSPGRYGLMLDTPQGAILLNKPVTGESMIAEVVGGKVFDFGELHYELNIDFK